MLRHDLWPDPVSPHGVFSSSLASVPDYLGRVPIPLRPGFAARVARVVESQRSAQSPAILARALRGGEWFGPFAHLLSETRPRHLPGLLTLTGSADILNAACLPAYRAGAWLPMSSYLPRVVEAHLLDPEGIFQLQSLIPFVWLVDESRLQGRPLPRYWDDLLSPCYRQLLMFGGWQNAPGEPVTECNRYLLLWYWLRHGPDGIRALADQVCSIRHHVRMAATFGRASLQDRAAIAILPWAQAELCVRPPHVRLVWPQDGALTMPIASLIQPMQAERLQPLIDLLLGEALAQFFSRNFYPSALNIRAGVPDWAALPAEARFCWPGWDQIRGDSMQAQTERAHRHFFAHWKPEV